MIVKNFYLLGFLVTLLPNPNPDDDGFDKPPKPPVFFARAPAARAPTPPAARPLPSRLYKI